MKKLDKLTIFLIPVGIAVNIVGGQIAIMLKLPIWLDSIGTILLGAICGIIPGLIVAGITQIINAISLPTILPYMIVGFAMAVLASVFAKKKMLCSFPKAILSGLIVAVVTTAIAVPMDVIIFGGFVGTGNSVIAAALMACGLGKWVAVLSSSFCFGLIDKVFTVLICYFIIRSMPSHFLIKLPLGSYFIKED